MSSWTKRLIALGLWVPFGAYAARELTLTLDRSVPAMSDAKLPERDKATKGRAAAKAAADATKADVQAVAFFQPGAGAFKDALTERFWAVENARLALDPGPNVPVFGGALKNEFAAAFGAQRILIEARLKLDAWFDRPVAKNAVAYLTDFLENYLQPYLDAKPPQAEAAVYDLRGRHKIAVASAAELAKRYADAVRESGVPLARSPELTRDAADLLKMYTNFKDVLAKRPVTEQNTTPLKPLAAQLAADEEDWRARNDLLVKFAVDPPGLAPEDAKKWFKDVNTQVGRLKDAATKAIIRDKVQQFCDALIPKKFALDSLVMVSTRTVERSDLKARYAKDGKLDSTFPVLTDDPDLLNEMTAKTKGPRGLLFDSFYLDASGGIDPNVVKPTAKSKASLAFLAARATVPEKNGWTRDTVARLLEKAGPAETGDKHRWDDLILLGKRGEYKVYERLKIVEGAISQYADLFENK
jgi:hypothetical protein